MGKQLNFLLWAIGALIVWQNRQKIIGFVKGQTQSTVPA